jgi:DNA-binding response OmpR family regulator
MNIMSETIPSKIKILIVDDEEDICYFLSGNLTKRGFSTAYSLSLAEAEKQLETNPPSLLLLDNHLPDGKGVDFLVKIKARFPELKTIMITAHDSPDDRLKAYRNGTNFFLSKPFTLSEVNQVVDLLLEQN